MERCTKPAVHILMVSCSPLPCGNPCICACVRYAERSVPRLMAYVLSLIGTVLLGLLTFFAGSQGMSWHPELFHHPRGFPLFGKPFPVHSPICLDGSFPTKPSPASFLGRVIMLACCAPCSCNFRCLWHALVKGNRLGITLGLAWLVGNTLHVCFWWFSGKSPLHCFFLFAPFQRQCGSLKPGF